LDDNQVIPFNFIRVIEARVNWIEGKLDGIPIWRIARERTGVLTDVDGSIRFLVVGEVVEILHGEIWTRGRGRYLSC
jgi:hypothetical protein